MNKIEKDGLTMNSNLQSPISNITSSQVIGNSTEGTAKSSSDMSAGCPGSLPQIMDSVQEVLSQMHMTETEAIEFMKSTQLNTMDWISNVFGTRPPTAASSSSEHTIESVSANRSINSSYDPPTPEFIRHWEDERQNDPKPNAESSQSVQTMLVHASWDHRLRNRILVIRDIYVTRRDAFLKDFARQWRLKRDRFKKAHGQIPVADKSVEALDQVMTDYLKRVLTSLQLMMLKRVMDILGVPIPSSLDILHPTRELHLPSMATSASQQPTSQQLQILETEYLSNPYWTKLHQKQIADKTNMSIEQVMSWYERRSTPSPFSMSQMPSQNSTPVYFNNPMNYFPEFVFPEFPSSSFTGSVAAADTSSSASIDPSFLDSFATFPFN